MLATNLKIPIFFVAVLSKLPLLLLFARLVSCVIPVCTHHSKVRVFCCPFVVVQMPRELAPERQHFGGPDGLISETRLGKTRFFWRCIHCSWEMGGRNFQNNKARIHLSGDPTLRSGLVSRVCTVAPENVKAKFANLERVKRENSKSSREKRRRSEVLLAAKGHADTTPTKQSRLQYKNKLNNDYIDDAWAEAFFGLDIPARKIDNDLFRRAIAATKRAKTG